MEDMAALVDKVLVMNGGKLEMFDTVENVFSQGERLREMGLNVPIVTRIFSLLKEKGVDVNPNVFTVEQAVAELKRIKEDSANA